MLYLYLGFLFIQLFPVINKFTTENIAISAMFFSVIVLLIWSFIPLIGYLASKLIKTVSIYNKGHYFLYGTCIALIENGLFYFELLSAEQHVLSTVISFSLFFISVFIPRKQTDTL